MENLVRFGCKNCFSPHLRERDGKLHCISCGAVFERNVETAEERDARILYLSRLDSAEKLLRMSPPRFDDAEDHFRDFIKLYPDHCDGYWGLVRARYGIKYEDDVTGRKIPSCYKSSYKDFRKDSDFMKALHFAENDYIRNYIQEQAELIADICKEWREEAEKYNYDVFISFKDKDEKLGISDADHREMNNLYDALKDEGYSVFFSPRSMRNYTGKHYDPYIFNALQSAKIMIVYGSNPNYFTTTWVQNEWTRFLKMEENGEKKKGSCIVAYNGFSPYELPPQLRKRQAVDASQRRYYLDIFNCIKKILAEEKKVDTNEELMRKLKELQRQNEENQKRQEELQKSLEEKKENSVKQVEQKPSAPSSGEKNATKAPSKVTPKEEPKKPEIDPDFEIVDGHLVAYKGNKTDIVIPNSVTSIDNHIFSNKNITSVVISDRVTSIGDKMFCGCVKLESVVIPDSVTSIGNQAFLGCRNLKSVVIPDSVTTIGKGAFSDCKNLSNVTIGNNVESIEERAFEKCEQLVSIKIPDRVAFIGESAFYNCTNLASVVIGKRVYYIESYAFMGCDNLFVVYDNSKLNLGIGYITDGYIAKYAKILVRNGVARYADDGYAYTLTDDGFLFRKKDHKYELIAYIGGEDTITLPQNINGNHYEICNLTGIRNVIIPNSFTTINDYAFKNCKSLTSVAIPDSVTSIGYSAFSCCESLTDLTIPNGVTSIDNWAFWGCSSLESVVIPDSVTSIGDDAFRYCDSLVSVTIPNSVTSINDSAFYGCKSLAEIVIPNSVISINSSAFEDCKNLKNIYYTGSKKEWKAIKKGIFNLRLKLATVHFDYVLEK